MALLCLSSLGSAGAGTADLGCSPLTLASVTPVGPLFGLSVNASLSADGRYAAFYFEPSDGYSFPEGVIRSGVRPVPPDVKIIGMMLVKDNLTAEVFEVHTDWVDGAGYSWSGQLEFSSDGSTVVFTSTAELVSGDRPHSPDVFAVDWRQRSVEAISVNDDGALAKAWSDAAAVSPDGRFVAFSSDSTNLSPAVTTRGVHVYRRDRLQGVTTLVSVAPDGAPGDSSSNGNWVSADGEVVVFSSFASNLVRSDTNGKSDVFMRHLSEGLTTRASVSTDGAEADGWSWGGGVSSDGRYIGFRSKASNLTPYDVLNKVPDSNVRSYSLFRRDTALGVTELVSYGVGGVPALLAANSGPSLSGDGRTIAFASNSPTLDPPDLNDVRDVFVNRMDGTGSRMVTRPAGGGWSEGWSDGPRVSDDGRFVSFTSVASDLVPDDQNPGTDVFIACITNPT